MLVRESGHHRQTPAKPSDNDLKKSYAGAPTRTACTFKKWTSATKTKLKNEAQPWPPKIDWYSRAYASSAPVSEVH